MARHRSNARRGVSNSFNRNYHYYNCPNNDDRYLEMMVNVCGRLAGRALMLPPLFLFLVLCFWATSTLLPVSVLHICVSNSRFNVYCFSTGTEKLPQQMPYIDDIVSYNTTTVTAIGPSDVLLVQGNAEPSFQGQDGHLQKTVTASRLSSGSSLKLFSETKTSSTESPPSVSVAANVSDHSNFTIPALKTTTSPENDRKMQQAVSKMDKKEKEYEGAPVRNPFESEAEIALRVVKNRMDFMRAAAYPLGKKPSAETCQGRRVHMYDLPKRFNEDLVRGCKDMVPWQDLCSDFSNGGMGEPLPSLNKNCYKTHQYALELVFHSRMLRYPCLSLNANEADLFYIPYYAGLDVLRWHFRENATHVQRDQLPKELITWLKARPTWNRHGGRDHLLVLGKVSWDFRRVMDNEKWGSSLLRFPEMENPVKLLIEREPWQDNEIAVPHPTFFHPHSDADIREWQAKIMASPRKHLVGFAGAPRPESTGSIRSRLIAQCKGRPDLCGFLNCKEGACFNPEKPVGLFMTSEFCLQPPGDSPTRRSVFESLVAGCIPVLFDPFTAYYQYAWHLPSNDSAYSVYVAKEEVKEGKVNVMEVLEKIPAVTRREMRHHIVYNLMPGLVYGDPGSAFEKFQDAFQISLTNLFWRLKKPTDNAGNDVLVS